MPVAVRSINWFGLVPKKGQTMKVTDDMVSRFLSWPLPKGFGPDCYITFDREKAETNNGWPVGTNLLTAEQARAMLEHVLDAAPMHMCANAFSQDPGKCAAWCKDSRTCPETNLRIPTSCV